MTYRNLAHVFFLASALSVGCGGGGDDDIGGKLDDFEGAIAAQADAFCDCYAQFPEPYASKQECVSDQYQPIEPALQQCLEDAFAVDTDASIAVLDCETAAWDGFATCLQQTLDCNDFMNTYLACFGQLDTEISACPAFPANVDTAASQCAGA